MRLTPSKQDVQLSVLIVNYRTPDLILNCLESIFRETLSTSIEVLVWDNASGDQSVDVIADRFPHVHLVASPENIGFGAANNRLATEARANKILLLNPDTTVLDNAIDRLYAFAGDRPEAQVWGGRTVFPDGTVNPTCCWALPTLWSCLAQALGLSRLFAGSLLFNPEGIGGWARNSERNAEMLSGCFLLINSELWRRLGGFDPIYWMYSEDADLCVRSRSEGARPLFTPSATICHWGGASETVRAEKVLRLFTARTQFLHQHWSRGRARLGTRMLNLHVLVRWAGYSLLSALGKSGVVRERDVWAEVWRRRHEWEIGSEDSRG